MIRPDNWGWKARIGMFIVASEAVPEAEWWAMAPAGVSVHAARVTALTPWARWASDERRSVVLEDDLERGARQFAAMQLSAVVTGHSSSSLAGGPGWDEAVVEHLAGMLPAGVFVTTNGLDCQAALEASGVRHPFVVFPACFGDAILGKGVEYFRARGFDPAGQMRFDPGPGWRDLPPAKLYPEGMGFAQDVEALYRQIRVTCPPNADGVLIVGTGFRCVGILDALEIDLGRPVISANQASLWQSLRQTGVKTAVEGYGNLLRI